MIEECMLLKFNQFILEWNPSANLQQAQTINDISLSVQVCLLSDPSVHLPFNLCQNLSYKTYMPQVLLLP